MNYDNANLRQLTKPQLKKAFEIGAGEADPDFEGLDLSGLDFSDFDLRRANMTDASLRGIGSLQGSTLNISAIEKETDKWDKNDLSGVQLALGRGAGDKVLSVPDSWNKIEEIYKKRSSVAAKISEKWKTGTPPNQDKETEEFSDGWKGDDEDPQNQQKLNISKSGNTDDEEIEEFLKNWKKGNEKTLSL